MADLKRLLLRLPLLLPMLLLLPAFEFTVRFEDWARFGVPLNSPAVMVEDLAVIDSTGQHARPSSAFRQFRINALGFRGGEVPDSLIRSRPLVIASGASETFGLYESPDHEWPRQMADSLATQCGPDRITVLNAAFAGMALPTVIQDVEFRLLQLNPRVIVYYPTPSQYLYGVSPRPSLRSNHRVPVLSPWRSRALPKLRDAVKSAIPEALLESLRRVLTNRLRESGETLFPALPADRLDSMELHLRILVGAVRRGHSSLVLVLPQNVFSDTTAVFERRLLRAWEHMVPKANSSILVSFSKLASTRIRLVAADSGVTLVDPALSARSERASLFADGHHFSDRGAAIMAGTVSNSVAELLGCTAPRSDAAHMQQPPSRP